MSGIRAYGAYIPRTRLPLALIQGRAAKDGGPEKAVAGDDEDVVTMAVAAGLDCLGSIDRDEIDALIFASTSYAQREKQAATVVARAMDLRRDVQTQDVSGSLRCGSTALENAVHAVASGAARNVLVVAADCRMGSPRGALEAKLGDGAAAFLVSDTDVIAHFEGAHSVANEFQDYWRGDGENFTHTWEDRFIIQEGYTPAMVEVLRELLAKTGRAVSDFASAAIVSPDARSIGGVMKALDLGREQLQDLLIGRVGNTGAAYGLMLLAASLERAQPGEHLLTASYGDGAHAMAFEVQKAIEALPPRLGVSGHLDRRRPLKSYDSYLKSRGLAAGEWETGKDLGLSATIRFRERDADIGFVGEKCTVCEQIHFPRQRVCYSCRTKDSFERVRLSDRTGTVLSYTFDFFFPKAEPPTIVVITEVDGCRIQVQMADAEPADVKLDLPVKFTFRKIHDAGGKPNYFWKAVPFSPGDVS
jgi:hydroxymethylglutaryl-CoA synthase